MAALLKGAVTDSAAPVSWLRVNPKTSTPTQTRATAVTAWPRDEATVNAESRHRGTAAEAVAADPDLAVARPDGVHETVGEAEPGVDPLPWTS